jgi:hypothetical protein
VKRLIIILALALALPVLALGQATHDPLYFAEDSVHSSGARGRMCLAVRNDALVSLCGTDGDVCVLQVDSAGGLFVTLQSQGVEDVAETAAGTLQMIGSVRRDTAASSAGTTGDNATINTDATGNLWVVSSVLEDVAETAANPLLGVGSVRRDTAASSAGTTGDNATVNTDATGRLWVTGTVLEDVAEVDGGQTVLAGSVRRDTAATSAGTTGDVATINTDSTGNLWVNAGIVAMATPATALTCGQEDITSTGTAEQLGANACKEILVSCPTANTSDCYIRADAGNGVTGGAIIGKGDEIVLTLGNTNLLWVDAGTTNDDVSWCCVN